MMHRIVTGRMIAVWVLLALAGLPLAPVQAQMAAAESAQRIKPAPGLKATLWASEPLLNNPTNIDVDSRGRVWVAEGLNYRLTRGDNRRFPRVEQADRIKILEDTDGDGRADKVTVFADRIFPVPMGIAIEEHRAGDGHYQGCRVFVGNSPDLLVLEDADGDDKADKRYPLLTGFGGVDSDHGVHGMVLGADGKLYFTQGDGCCSVQQDHSERQQNFDVVDRSGRRVSSDQLANTLRVNRDGTQFEVICDRQRNNYETCLNSFGNIFTSDNDDDGNRGCRVIWAMDGAHYGYRTPGSARHWGEEVPGNVPKLVGTGNGSPCGIMVYEGNLLPSEYRGAVLEVDAGTRQVNAFPISRKGASFRTDYRIFLGSDDPWFRPVDACAAPDGSIFVADWYDAGVGGHAFSDQTTGRIYRVAPDHRPGQPPRPDFSTFDGLLAALRSPNIATSDVARRLLIARGKDGHDRADQEIRALLERIGARRSGFRRAPHPDAIHVARIWWVIFGICSEFRPGAWGDLRHVACASTDPRIREMAVRMLGRDCRENGRVAYQKPEARQQPAALANLGILLAMAGDPDAGVRRELILALRNVPTEQAAKDHGTTPARAQAPAHAAPPARTVGDALRKLAGSWDGQDRWYLEALGLALEARESEFLTELFDGSLYGDLDLDRAGRESKLALPPYFPVDRNEAYIPAGAPDLLATALSKYLGLAWRIHRREALPLLERVLPHLRAAELQQAGDDVLEQFQEPQAAAIVARLALSGADPLRQLGLCAILARRLSREWNGARDEPAVVRLIEQALGNSETRAAGIAMAASTRDGRYGATMARLAVDSASTAEVRVAAIEALASLAEKDRSRGVLETLIAAVSGKPSSTAVAEAAVRAVARLSGGPARLTELLIAADNPLGVRREALRSLAQLRDGGSRVLELARAGKIPGDLKNEATTLLYTSAERRIREAAATVLPLPQTAGGRPLPPIGELVRRDGDADKGRAVFFRAGTNSCGGCHRVQGRGQWVGPDLSTIGVKYGRDELVRSILSPSTAIGYSFRSVVVALADGRVITGLPVEETADRLVLKTAAGERIVIPPGSIENQRTSDVSLMPDGLSQTMAEQELVDLIAYLATLREPVGIVGQYNVMGPVHETAARIATQLDPSSAVDLESSVNDGQGHQLSWRRMNANAEGLLDLSVLAAGESRGQASVYAYTPVVAVEAQPARLVIESAAAVTAWLGGKPVSLTRGNGSEHEPWSALVDLPSGQTGLLIRITCGGRSPAPASLVTTIVAGQPVSFAAKSGALPAADPLKRRQIP
jgi:putative membrane-bound dehydrogenase-like protein